MKLIAHRGNINGPNPEKENHPDYINTAIKSGYDVEVDVWFIDNKTGGGFTFKQAVITDKPRQAQIAEGIDALNFMLKVKSFDVVDKIK